MAAVAPAVPSRGNLSVVLRAKGDLKLEEHAIPSPDKGEVLLAIQSAGICGSDVHFLVEGRIGDFVLTEPVVLGHECSGVVLSVGEGVTSLKPGDRVVMEPAVPCRTCSFCKAGRYHLCPDVKCASCPPVSGAMARYFVHAADFCYKLPDQLSFEEGALVEPVSVGVHACERAGVEIGSKVLICGAGSIGLTCLLVARTCGASSIIVTDLDECRLKVARQLGASHTVAVDGKDSKTLARAIVDTLGCQPDRTFECSGAPSSIATAIYSTMSGGVVVLVGLGPADATIPIVDAAVREVDIRGVFRYCNSFPKAIDLVASGRVNVKPLLTHTYKIEEALEAFEVAKNRSSGAIKVMVQCNEH